MITNANLIEGSKKNNTEKYNYSISGFLWSEKQINNNDNRGTLRETFNNKILNF